MDADLADSLGILETDKLPCLPCVFRFIDPFSGHRIAADTRLACAGIDHVWIGFSDHQSADDADLEEAIRDIDPGDSPVFTLPHTPACGTEVEGERLIFV